MKQKGQPASDESVVRHRRRTLILTLLWIGLLVLMFGAGWLVFDQLTASRVHIVNGTPHSVQLTLAGTGFQQTVAVEPSSEQTVRLDVTADTSLRIAGTTSDGRSFSSVGGYFTPGDGQTTEVILEGSGMRVIPGG